MQPYITQEDEIWLTTQKFENGRHPYFFENGRRPSFFLKGRRPNFFENRRRHQICLLQMEDDLNILVNGRQPPRLAGNLTNTKTKNKLSYFKINDLIWL